MGTKLDVNVVATQKVSGWMQGVVTSCEGDFFDIEFPGSSSEYDFSIDRWSTDIAPIGSKTSEDYKWRADSLQGCEDFLCDVYDGQDWLESTIFRTKIEEDAPGRQVEKAYVAFRVYRTTGKKMRQDERGIFDGWSSKYDEWIPIYSPLIVPHLTKS